MDSKPSMETLNPLRSVESSLARRMADRITSGLKDASVSTWVLIDWLEGYNVPSVDFHDDTYVCIYDGFGELEAADRDGFVGLVEQLLREQPDVKRPGNRPDEVLYNLFMLCARLGKRERLGKGLREVYQRTKSGIGLKGQSFQGLDLRNTLLLALIANQDTRDLVPVWDNLLETGRNDTLPGTEYSGFYGMLAADPPGKPDWGDLGRALSAMVDYLTPHRKIRLKKLDDLFGEIKKYHGFTTEADGALIQIAHKHKWRTWAVDWLPGIWIRRNDPANPFGGWVVWEPLWWHLYAFATRMGYHARFIEKLAGNRVVICEFDREVERFAEKIARCFEDTRRDPRLAKSLQGDHGNLAARFASTSCTKLDWGPQASIIKEILSGEGSKISKTIIAEKKSQPQNVPALV